MLLEHLVHVTVIGQELSGRDLIPVKYRFVEGHDDPSSLRLFEETLEGQLFWRVEISGACTDHTAGEPVPVAKRKSGSREVSFAVKPGEFQEEVRGFIQGFKKSPRV